MRPLKLRFVFETAFSRGPIRPMCPPKQAPQVGVETIAPVVALFVEDEAGVDGAGPAHDLREDLLGARHLRHPLGVDETRRLNPRETRGSQAVAQLRPDLRREPSVFVLQAVAGSDVHYLYAHSSDHPSLAQAFP